MALAACGRLFTVVKDNWLEKSQSRGYWPTSLPLALQIVTRLVNPARWMCFHAALARRPIVHICAKAPSLRRIRLLDRRSSNVQALVPILAT
jgi:hypothetical protein